MSDMVICTMFASVAAVLIARYIWVKPPNYYHRRMMADGNLQHYREASGPDPQIVVEMVLFPGKQFPTNRDEVEA